MTSTVRRGLVAVLAVLAVGVFGSSRAYAQGIGIGVKVGPTFNDFTSGGRVGAAVEFNYAKKNAEFVFDDGSKESLNISYLQIPVLLRFNGGSRTRDGVNVYGIVGPFFNFKLNAESDLDDAFDDSVEDIDTGITVGGGVEITRFII